MEFVDVYPTLADVCGLAIPGDLHGSSLKPLLENPAAIPTKKVAISQYPRPAGQTKQGTLMGYSVRDDRWRLTVWRNRKTGEVAATELYDELGDPAESVNLAAKSEHKPVIDRLSAYLP